MSLDGFQRALADLVASPRRCVELRDDPSLLDGHDLDDREQRRLLAMVRHDGMSHNCTLYRANRLTPIGRALPLTCQALGDRLTPELEQFWDAAPDSEIQFRLEAERFADFLQTRIDDGALDEIADGTLAAVLERERDTLDQQYEPFPHA